MRAIDDAPTLSAAGGQRLWRGHPAIEMVAKVPADDREGDGPMVKRDAGIDFEIIGLRKNIVDDVLVRIFQSTRYPQPVAVGKAVRIFHWRVTGPSRPHAGWTTRLILKADRK